MDVINLDEGHYEQRHSLEAISSSSDLSSHCSDSESYEQSNCKDDVYLKEDLQQTVLECYKSQSDLSLPSSSNESQIDEELQASLCQFMDILNDLDQVLDKSLLNCLDGPRLDSDDGDVVTKIYETCELTEFNDNCGSNSHTSDDDDNDDVVIAETHPSAPSLLDLEIETNTAKPLLSNLGRSKSFTDLSNIRQVSTLERSNENDNTRESMRRLDPIVLPALTNQEPLTLPVILFLEHNVHMRPTSAPIQLQVTAANLRNDSPGPLIVGRHALLMNRALSMPSPGGSDVTAEWTAVNTGRSDTRSTSGSSSSSDSLSGSLSNPQNLTNAVEERVEETEAPPFGVWPHRLSAMLACLSCTVGIFNISRFAMFSVHFGASFIVQFFILSFLFGIPLFTLYLCLGRVLESGPVDMWRISPIFQGVGISMLVTQAVLGIYSVIGVSWIFVYFRDSFITSQDKYKWAVPHDFNIDDPSQRTNETFKIQHTVPQYFHAEVLQKSFAGSSYVGAIKFQVAFNLAVVWMIVFVSLSKGLRSYGKAVYLLIFLPICGTLVLCIKLLTLIPYDTVTNIFVDTEWTEFFINSNSWAAATQETFLTWGLLGACIMQLTSHKNAKSKSSSVLQRESACIVAFTLAVLLLASFLANTCVQILRSNGFFYVPGSFENIKTSQFLWPRTEPLPSNGPATPLRYMGHYGSLVGVTIWRSGPTSHQTSGYTPLELITQIVPATLAVQSPHMLSPAWAVIFYFILIMFGIAQQLAIWHSVIAGIIAINAEVLKVWETTITFLSCVFGLAMGLILTTDAGIRIIHFVDYVAVGSWCQCLIHVALACGVFVVRGRPYSGEAVVAALFTGSNRLSLALGIMLSFTWNVVLPVVLCVVCVIDFRIGQQRVLYNWRRAAGYWPIWCRQLAVLIQQGLLLTIPITAFIQTWRYISKGPPDILDRIQNLYRPRMDPDLGSPPPPIQPNVGPLSARPVPADPPPKYTPPPSYSTATGARLLNTIRRSFRNLRRITIRPESNPDDFQSPITISQTVDQERNTSLETRQPDTTNTNTQQQSLTITNEDGRQSSSRNSLPFTRDILRRSFVKNTPSHLRSSLRRSFKYGSALTNSHEHLVRDAEPMSNTVAMSAVMDSDSQQSRSSII